MWKVDKYRLRYFRREFLLLLLYPFILLLILFLIISPSNLREKIGNLGGNLYYKHAHKARKIAIKNILSVYGFLSLSQVKEMAREVFVNQVYAFVDFISFIHVRRKDKFFQYVEVKGEEHLKRAYDKGRGVICLVPHISSWELSAVTPPMMGYPTVAASKPIKGFLIQKTMVWFRKRRGMVNFVRMGSYDNLVKSLREGKCVILMIDQDTKVKSCFVKFFGKDTFTPLGASRLSLETGASVVPMAMKHIENSKYIFEIYPALCTLDTGNMQKDLIDNTQNQSNVIEQIIKTNTTQWVWMHDRWKTTPEKYAEYLENKKKHQK